MSAKTFGASDPRLETYVSQNFHAEDEVMRMIRELGESRGVQQIQVSACDGLHLETLTQMVGAKTAVEIGTLYGYSGVRIARNLAPGGRLYTCEFSESNAQVAREAFQIAGLEDRIELLLGPALETLPSLQSKGPFDLVFIDADKKNYPAYLDWAIDHLAPGGVILGDNTFAWGTLVQSDEELRSPESILIKEAIHRFNTRLAEHPDFVSTILPTGEGLTVGVKKSH